MVRINIGCGQTNTKGWRNFDNSFSLKLAKFPLLVNLLMKLKLLNRAQYSFVQFAVNNSIEFGNAAKRLPLQDKSVDVIYNSHMLEHLDQEEANKFLKETRRLLRPGGIIRIVVPDISRQVENYIKTGDANAFIETTLLCKPRPKSFAQKMKYLIIGTRHHQWMYDGNSLCNLLDRHGFVDAKVMFAGETYIENHEPLNLQERESESVYVEARQPNNEPSFSR